MISFYILSKIFSPGYKRLSDARVALRINRKKKII